MRRLDQDLPELLSFSPASVGAPKWYEYAMLRGLSRDVGPSVGGLFLTFPEIFHASMTLIEKHERERSLATCTHSAEPNLRLNACIQI